MSSKKLSPEFEKQSGHGHGHVYGRDRAAAVHEASLEEMACSNEDRHRYRERCLVAHLFQRIKRFRRIATRFEKLARNFLAFLLVAAVLVWLL